MLLCTSGVMGLNKFFAKRQEEGLFEEQDGDKATDVATPRTPRRAADSSIVWETGAGGSSESDHDRGLSGKLLLYSNHRSFVSGRSFGGLCFVVVTVFVQDSRN